MLQKGTTVKLYEDGVVAKPDDGGNDYIKAYCSEVKPRGAVGFEKQSEQLFDCILKDNGCALVTGANGVGKSALVRNIQKLICDMKCPTRFFGVKIYEINMLRLISGIKSISDYEDRLGGILGGLLADGKSIAYIDNIYQFTMDNNINAMTSLHLESYIGRGLPLIACCSSDDLKNLDSKYHLMRHFTEVCLKEPSLDDTKAILMHNADMFYDKYKVVIDEGIVDKVVMLSDKYIKNSRFKMPMKAMESMEQVAAHHLNTVYGSEGKVCKKIERLREIEAETRSIMDSDCPDYGRVVELDEEHSRVSAAMELDRKLGHDHRIDDSCVYSVISDLARVPVAKLTESDTAKLKNMYRTLTGIVIGQDETVDKLCKTIKRNRLGLRKKNHTIGNFMFVGQTGVGKTMLAKELTRYMFGNYDAMIRLDMSEYIDEISVNKLIGAPPGYVGYGEGGVLCNAIKKNPYAVILFDEIEKAHPSVFNTLLQLLDEGHITDANGNKVSAMNCVVIMTSNIGLREANSFANTIGFSPSEEAKERSNVENQREIIDSSIRKRFAPEFINRMDSICYFNNLGRDTIEKIFDNEIAEVCTELKKIGHTLKVRKDAKRYIVDKSEKEKMGARPLIRIIQQEITDEMTDLIINGGLGETITVGYDRKNGKLKFL